MKNIIFKFVFILSVSIFISADCVDGFQDIIAEENKYIEECPNRFYANNPAFRDLCIQDAKNDAERQIEELAYQCGFYY